jgi:hypothetical protein
MLNTKPCITSTGNRQKDGYTYTDPVQVRKQEEAFIALTKYELAYGALVTDLSDTHVSLETYVMSCKDITTFTGSKEDMEPLVRVASAYALVRQTAATQLHSRAFALLESLTKKSHGNDNPGVSPLVTKLAGGMVIGGQAVRYAVAVAYDLVELIPHTTTNNMLDAAMLVVDGFPREEVVEAYIPVTA